MGLFKITEAKGLVNYCLKLPKTININPVFYISLLELVPKDILLVLITKIKLVNPNTKYKVKDILDNKLVRGKLYYLIK